MILDKKTVKSFFRLSNINSVIKFLTLSDILLIGSFGLIAPIFAVFVTDSLVDGSLEVVGIASTVYLLTKSVFQLLAAAIADKIKGEKDDFWVMIVSSIIMSLIPLLYLAISTAWHLYIVQFIYGLAAAFSYPAWMAIFTRHIDKNSEGREWGVYYTLTDLAAAGTAAIGGVVAYHFGFAPLFVTVSIVSLIGALSLGGIYKVVNKKGLIDRIIK